MWVVIKGFKEGEENVFDSPPYLSKEEQRPCKRKSRSCGRSPSYSIVQDSGVVLKGTGWCIKCIESVFNVVKFDDIDKAKELYETCKIIQKL